MLRQSLVGLLLSVSALLAAAQTNFPSRFKAEIAALPKVAAALRLIDEGREQQLQEWIHLTEIPAPSKMEQQRAAYMKAEFEKAGLSNVRVDDLGNCEGTRKGMSGAPTLVFAAHIDTVHPLDTPLKVRREGNRLHAPGVFDNTASCVNLLAALRAMNGAGLRTKGEIIFLATVREEIGLAGMRHWLERNRERTGLLVALDSSLGSVLYGALGIRWFKFIYTAEGAHTLYSRGKPNPALAIAQAMRDIYTIPLPPPGNESTAIYNVGIIGGGKVVNAVSQESFFTLDLRSNNPFILKSLTEQVMAFVEAAARTNSVELTVEKLHDSPAGGTAKQLASRRAHPIVQTAVDILTYLNANQGKPVEAVAAGSTDANIGVEMGLPAIAVGRAFGGGQHTLQEWADIDSTYLGTKQIILLAACLAELAD